MIYISGPMEGYEEWNAAAFKVCRDDLRERGFRVVCPSEESEPHRQPGSEKSREFHMRRDIEHVLQVEQICALDGWERSRGACLEIAVALEVGIPVWRYSNEGAITFTEHPWYVSDPRSTSYADIDVFQSEVKEWAERNFGVPENSRWARLEDLYQEAKRLRGGTYANQALGRVLEALDAVDAAPENAPPPTAYRPLLGMVEELGELARAQLKGEQGIRFTPEQIADMKLDAVGDVFVYAADYCNRERIRMYEALERAWGEVKKRDWKANPMNAADVALGVVTSEHVPEGEGFALAFPVAHDALCLAVVTGLETDCCCGALGRAVSKIKVEDSGGTDG